MSKQLVELKNAQKNGKVQPVKTAKVADVKKVSAKIEKAIINIAPSAEQRIKRMENFEIITKKYQHLKTKNDELQKFKISSDGTNENLVLKNGDGYTFKVSNSVVMGKIVNLLQTELNSLFENSEKEVREFEI